MSGGEDLHWCICGRPSYDHPEECYEDVDFDADSHAQGHAHLPPLCCPDCPCLSYAEAHPDSEQVPDWARELVVEDRVRRNRADLQRRIKRAKWREAYWRKKIRKAEREKAAR